MILERCLVTGFGRIGKRSFEFHPRFTVVFAPNEAGKSTLQRFLIAMLYGQLRSDLRAQRRLEAWVEGFKPWDGSEYGGNLVCRLDAGREIEVRRTFGREDARVEIRTATGEEITRSYEVQRNGEVLFARTHLGLPKDLFESLAVIRENRAGDLDGREGIRDRIANLSQTGDEDLSVRQSLERLETALEEIGSERAPTRPYRLALDRVQELLAEKAALEAKRAEFDLQLQDRGRLGNEIVRADAAWRSRRAAASAARWWECAERVRQLEELDREIAVLRRGIEESPGRTDFPVDLLENLDRLVGAGEGTAQRATAARRRNTAADAALAQAGEARAETQAFAALPSETDAHLITEWMIGWIRSGIQRDEAQKDLHRFAADAQSLGRRLSTMGPALADAGADWQRKSVEYAQAQSTAADHAARMGERIAARKADLAVWQTKIARARWGAAGAALGALAAGAGWRMDPLWIPLGVTGLLAALALLLLRSLEWAKTASALAAEISGLERERAGVLGATGKLRAEISGAMASSGHASLEKFLAAAEEAERIRARLADLEQRMRETEEKRRRTANEASELFARIQETLAVVALSCAPATLKNQVDQFRAGYRRFREAEAFYAARQKEADEASAEVHAVLEEQKALDGKVGEILMAAGVPTVADFRRGCEARTRIVDLKSREAARSKEFARLSAETPLAEWCRRLKSAEDEMARHAAAAPAAAQAIAAGAPLLPYAPSSRQAEEEERRTAAELASLREKHARVAERVERAFSGCRLLSEIEEDLVEAQARAARLGLNRDALEVALETIQRLSREQQEILAPRLNRLVEERFLRLAVGRYAEVKIDLDFNVRVREAGGADLRPASSLSRGAQDQLYLAVRFGVLDMVSGPEDACPSLLDEPFAAYDHNRLEEAFRILEEESRRRQLLLFTCREDVREMAQRHGARPLPL